MKQTFFVNRRVRPRVDVMLKANFRIDDQSFPGSECIITNISVSGAGLVFNGLPEDSIAPGRTAALDFFIPGTDRRLHVLGEIVWTKRFPQSVAAGINFSDPLSFEEIIMCCRTAEMKN